MENTYPTLRLGVLQGIASLKALCDAEPGYLRKPACPYDNDTVKLLERLFKPVEVVVEKEVYLEKPARGKVGRPKKDKELSDEETAELEDESKELLKELRQLDKTLDGEIKQLDTKTKLDIIKVRANLLEKLLSIRERFTSARKVAEFQSIVIGILDDIVPEAMRDEMLKRLEEYL